MRHRQIINELNRENRRRDLGYPLLSFSLGLGLAIAILLLVINADLIDAFAYKYPKLVGWTLVIIGLSGIIYKELRRW